MQHSTEYAIRVNGAIIGDVAFSDKSEAVRFAAEWREMCNDYGVVVQVDIMHRRVVRYEWFLTTDSLTH